MVHRVQFERSVSKSLSRMRDRFNPRFLDKGTAIFGNMQSIYKVIERYPSPQQHFSEVLMPVLKIQEPSDQLKALLYLNGSLNVVWRTCTSNSPPPDSFMNSTIDSLLGTKVDRIMAQHGSYSYLTGFPVLIRAESEDEVSLKVLEICHETARNIDFSGWLNKYPNTLKYADMVRVLNLGADGRHGEMLSFSTFMNIFAGSYSRSQLPLETDVSETLIHEDAHIIAYHDGTGFGQLLEKQNEYDENGGFFIKSPFNPPFRGTFITDAKSTLRASEYTVHNLSPISQVSPILFETTRTLSNLKDWLSYMVRRPEPLVDPLLNMELIDLFEICLGLLDRVRIMTGQADQGIGNLLADLYPDRGI